MADLHVSKKTIGKLFSEMQNRKFIIPDYQRPYKWNIEKCETLWEDIENFAQTDAKKGADYFLGTIVSYNNKQNDLEIIDGQQRITSFFLLLRSFYKKLEAMPEDDDDVKGLKNQLAPCVWDINPISQKVTDKTKIHIESLVATESDNETFHEILKTGEALFDASDNYSRNYLFFKQKCNEYASTNPMQWKELCVTILQNCILLPIECDTPETALTIFSTLNDRGMPLSDSDIFKAQIYRSKATKSEREDFTSTWKDLTAICEQGGVSIDDVFRYYTHILRARNNDKTKEIGLRKFYSETNYYRLKKDGFIEEIMELANFWRYINKDVEPEYNSYTISIKSRKLIHCLFHYPNDYWKYPLSVFFIKNKDSQTFSKDLTLLLRKLLASLVYKFIGAPTVNAIKGDIYQSCITIINNNELSFRINWDEETLLSDFNNHHSSRISRVLLLLDAYLNPNQTELIPYTFDIEHIFPKKWQNTNYNGWEIEDANKYLDRLGNKVILEKKLNIQAGNGYFGVKKNRYANSKIANVIDLANYPKDDWVKTDIEQREEDFKENITSFFKKHFLN